MLAGGRNGHFTETGRYVMDLEQHAYRWPEHRSVLLEDALDAAEREDVYVAPLLMSEPVRRKRYAMPGRHVWCDVDSEPSPETKGGIRRLTNTDNSFVVSSGRGCHVYVACDELFEPEQIEVLNRRLMVALNGDTKWGCESLLRLPGTWNYKPRAQGHRPSAVRIQP
jgi:hypothetical protein